MQEKNILSINFNHDGSGVILSNGVIKAYLNTERFSKKKKHPGIRREDLDNLLDQAGMQLGDLGMVILCNINTMDSPDIPFLYGTSLKETFLDVWVHHSMKKLLIDGVEIPCIINPDHQLLHCSLAYYTSPFDEAMCFSWDPTGFGAFIGKGNKMIPLGYSLSHFNKTEWYYNVSAALFGTGIEGAGKVMGLAPYGGLNNEQLLTVEQVAGMEELYELSGNGNSRIIEENGKQLNATLAFNVQQLLEEQLCTVLADLYKIAGEKGIKPNICLSGGGALNSVANQVAFRNSRFERIHLHPASGDDGTAIGAALYHWFDELDNERRPFTNRQMMYSIRTYDDKVEQLIEQPQYKDAFLTDRTPDYIRRTAEHLANGKIVGWFQGASEIGPRALGNRSILADPRNPEMKDILNRKVKFREGFRPFAPSVLNEHAEQWFGLKDSPFMLRVCDVLEDSVPAISHVDHTARIQTVSPEDNATYYQLIKCFYELTGVPLLINTSFNIKGEPIVETPEDALRCFLNTGLDLLVFRNVVLEKQRTPAFITASTPELQTARS
ncbi:carbamoyltransferase family protein [Puia sp.]|jgi:carbamoyltransferase|uniref:carbamoyltransferase family protein n=1 Tax=Puia sp. TaxID=2045100 RepID=UPI002F42E4DD